MQRLQVAGCLAYLEVSLPVCHVHIRGRGSALSSLPARARHTPRACCRAANPVLPAVLLPLARSGEADEESICDALYVAAGRGAMLHCFCAVPEDWETLELSYRPAFAAGQPVEFVVRRDADAVRLGPVPATPAEVGSVVDL